MAIAVVLGLAACQAPSPVVAALRFANQRAVFQVGPTDLAAAPLGQAVGAPPAPLPTATPTPSRSDGGSSSGAGGTPPAVAPRRSGGGRSAPRSAPSPASTPTPLENTLDAGPGALAGGVLDVVAAGAAVADAAITVVSLADPAKRAVVTTAQDGRWQVGGIALGTYLVSVEKVGFTAGAAPIEVILYPSSPTLLTVNFAVTP